MKPRRVIVQLEIETDARLSALREKTAWMLLPDEVGHTEFTVNEIRTNVVKK